jgi:hypothetical protein
MAPPLRCCGKSRRVVSSGASGRLDSPIWPYGVKVARDGPELAGDKPMLLVLINVLIIVVVGALLFYLIERFVRDGRLANLLKILVVLICLAAIVQRLLPMLGVGF